LLRISSSKFEKDAINLSAPDYQCFFGRFYPCAEHLHSLIFVHPGPTLQSTFPYYSYPPACFAQPLDGPLVVRDITVNFGLPEIFPRRGPSEQVAGVVMPETAIYEHDRPVSGKHEVRFPRQLFRVKAETKPRAVQCLANGKLRLRMAAFDGSHVPASRWGIVNVCQDQAAFRRCALSMTA
jgi:hypothetical protein